MDMGKLADEMLQLFEAALQAISRPNSLAQWRAEHVFRVLRSLTIVRSLQSAVFTTLLARCVALYGSWDSWPDAHLAMLSYCGAVTWDMPVDDAVLCAIRTLVLRHGTCGAAPSLPSTASLLLQSYAMLEERRVVLHPIADEQRQYMQRILDTERSTGLLRESLARVLGIMYPDVTMMHVGVYSMMCIKRSGGECVAIDVTSNVLAPGDGHAATRLSGFVEGRRRYCLARGIPLAVVVPRVVNGRVDKSISEESVSIALRAVAPLKR